MREKEGEIMNQGLERCEVVKDASTKDSPGNQTKPKVRVAVMLDADIHEAIRGCVALLEGARYQSFLNELLREVLLKDGDVTKGELLGRVCQRIAEKV